MIEASNLGQIIGRARYGALERRAQPALAAAEAAARVSRASEKRHAATLAEREEDARRADNAATHRTLRRRAPARAPAPATATTAKAPRARRGKVAALEALLGANPQGLRLPELRAALRWETDDLVKRLRLLPIVKRGRRRHYLYSLKENA